MQNKVNAIPHGFARLAGSEKRLPPQAQQIGLVNPDEEIAVSVYLRSMDTLEHENGSRGARHEKTHSQEMLVGSMSDHAYNPGPRIARADYKKHGASPKDINTVIQFANEHHLNVIEQDERRRKVVLTGRAEDLMNAFAVELQRYEHDDHQFRGRQGFIHIPMELEDTIVGVFGLDNRKVARPHFRLHEHKRSEANANLATYYPTDVAKLYNFPQSLDGSGQCIGLIELGGGYNQAELDTYFQQVGVQRDPIIPVSVDNISNQPTGDPGGPDAEVVLDIAVTGSIAVGARIAVYFSTSDDRGFLDAVSAAIHDTTNKPSVISISWGGAEANWTEQAIQQMNSFFQEAAALGITILCACGDDGSSDNINDGQSHVDFPASSPYVLGCGGTRLIAEHNQITKEVAWNELTIGGGATGGGVSDIFPLPDWQTNIGVPPSYNDEHSGRGVPDIAGNADPQTGYKILVDGQNIALGGTSAVAPLWAALIAQINQQRGQNVGYLNPFLYQNYASLAQTNALRDITRGNNGDYSAKQGWDACTGLGSPNGLPLLNTLFTMSMISMLNASRQASLSGSGMRQGELSKREVR